MPQNTAKKTDWKFITGAGFIIFFSVITGILNIGIIYLAGIPLFAIFFGIALVWSSKKTRDIKLFWTILPLLIISSIIILLYKLNQAEPETFLIPPNFRGQITIIYEEPCGQQPIYENGRRLYEFPENGMLVTNFKKTKGILNQEFYFVDETGARTEIPQKDVRDFNFKERLSKTDNEPSRDEVGAFFSYGTFPPFISGKYHSYIIANYRYFEKTDQESWLEGTQDSKKRKEILEECQKSLPN